MLRYRYMTDLTAIHGYTTTWVDYKRVDGHLQEVALRYDDRAPCASATHALNYASERSGCTTARHAPVLDKRQHSRPGLKIPQLGAGRVQAPPGCGSHSCQVGVHDIHRRGHSLEPSRPPSSSAPATLPCLPSAAASGAVALLHGNTAYNFNDNSSAADNNIDITASRQRRRHHQQHHQLYL